MRFYLAFLQKICYTKTKEIVKNKGVLLSELTKTMKLHLHADARIDQLFSDVTSRYAEACNYISQYVFDNGFILNYMELHERLYHQIRHDFGLKSQLTISAFKTVTARYKTTKKQLEENPFVYQDENDKKVYINKTLEWLYKPIRFRRPQADLVRNRDYSFVSGGKELSINTLDKRVTLSFDVPEYFEKYFDGTWSFGTGKLVKLKGEWYFHIPMTKEISDSFDRDAPKHVVGIDRGIRYLITAYDEKGETTFVDGQDVMQKRATYNKVRAELQAKGTKSAKRVLKRISGRENRWMSDVNHCISKALVDKYGHDTLFVLEDLKGVSFSEENLKTKDKEQKNEVRSWAFYQLEQDLTYKAQEVGSQVVKVSAKYTSQRCPKCGRIRKENRNRDTHTYTCDTCGFSANDDESAAMNIQFLGTLYVSGDNNPRFGVRKTE